MILLYTALTLLTRILMTGLQMQRRQRVNINVIAAPTDTDTRQQKITTILSTGDSSVDIVEINDEMSAAFKNSGWLEGLNDTVMTDDIIDSVCGRVYSGYDHR